MVNTSKLTATKGVLHRTGRSATKPTHRQSAADRRWQQIGNCQAAVALIAEYLNASLGDPRRHAFEQHLHKCPECSAFLNTYKKTRALTSAFLKSAGSQPALDFAALRSAVQRR